MAVIMSARGKHAGEFATRYSVYGDVFVCRQGIRAETMRVEAERPIRAEDGWKCHSVSEEVNKPDPTSPECFFIKASHTHISVRMHPYFSRLSHSLLLDWIRWLGHCRCISPWAGGKGLCVFCRSSVLTRELQWTFVHLLKMLHPRSAWPINPYDCPASLMRLLVIVSDRCL